MQANLKQTIYTDHAVWALGFRPFFLAGGCASFIFLLLWLFSLQGYLPPLSVHWHAHEMLFGFGGAIFTGFILTSTQSWTGQRGIHGKELQLLVASWLAGRIGMLSGIPVLSATLDLLFLPMLTVFLHRYLSEPKQARNRVFYVLMALQLTSNLLFHGEKLFGWQSAQIGIYAVLNVYILMIMLIGGRIIPLFTRNGLKHVKAQSFAWLEKTSFILSAAWFISQLLIPGQIISLLVSALTALVHLLRWLGWKPWQTRQKPIIWILHVAYAWLILALVMQALPAPWAPLRSIVIHAFTAGAMGIMMFAMITRVALGHTGRTIEASKAIVVSYYLINFAAILRVFGIWFFPLYSPWIILSAGTAWVLAFVLFLREYTGYLIRPRPDGKVG